MQIKCKGNLGSPPVEYSHIHKDGWTYVHDVGEREFAKILQFFKEVEIVEWGELERPHRLAERDRIEAMLKGRK